MFIKKNKNNRYTIPIHLFELILSAFLVFYKLIIA